MFQRAKTKLIIFFMFTAICGLFIPNATAFAAGSLQNIALGKSYTLSPAPNYARCTDSCDSTQLTDGTYTTGYFWVQMGTVGWASAKPVIITIDLGEIQPISGISFNTAAGTGGGVLWPANIDILVSDDGRTYYNQGDLIEMSSKNGIPSMEKCVIHKYWTNELVTHGRYVQLLINTSGIYSFVDEIEVYKGDASWVSLPMAGESSSGGLNYFKYNIVTNSIKTRLRLDAYDAQHTIESSGLGTDKIAPLLNELSDIKNQITLLPHIDSNTYNAIMPMNDLESKIFAIIGEVRRMQGNAQLQAWVSNRYDDLSPTQAPAPDKDSKKEITVSMMSNEWRHAVVNLTSSCKEPMDVHIKIDGLPNGVNPDYISLYRVEWTDTSINKPIASALTEIKPDNDGYAVTIPAGMLRQIWFSFHPTSVPAGKYNGQVTIERAGSDPILVPIKLQIFPIIFPQKQSLHLGGWDYTNKYISAVTSTNRDMIIKCLKDHLVDSPWATYDVFTMGNFDSQGNMIAPSTDNFDKWIQLWPDTNQYYVFLNVSSAPFTKADMTKPNFNSYVKSWADFWANHIIEKGKKPEQFELLLVDEPSTDDEDQTIINWATAIKAAQPKFIIWEDLVKLKSPRESQDMHDRMISSVDVYCPDRPTLLADAAFENYVLGKRIDIYSCRGPMELMDPYSYIRLQAWTCWKIDAKTSFFWAFSDAGGGNLWQPYSLLKFNYSPMFITSDSVIPAKPIEAMRESVEDYEYLNILKSELSKASQSNPAYANAKQLLDSAPTRVLNAANANKIDLTDAKDKWIADDVNLEILQAITELRSGSEAPTTGASTNSGASTNDSTNEKQAYSGATNSQISSPTSPSIKNNEEETIIPAQNEKQDKIDLNKKDQIIFVSLPSVKDGRLAKIDITNSMVDQIIPNNDTDAIKIVLDNANKNQTNAIEISIPVQMIQKAKTNGITEIDTSLGLATLKIPINAFPTENAQTFSVVVERIRKGKELLKEQIKAVGSNSLYNVLIILHKTDGSKENISKLNEQIDVKIPYRLKPGEDPEKVTVFYLNDKGKLENKAGSHDRATQMVSFKTNHFSKYFSSYNNITFKDVGSRMWARKSIGVLAAKGIMNGKTKDNFMPNAKITGLEFTILLIKTLKAKNIETKKLASIYKNSFKSNNPIKKSEMVAMLKKVVDILGAQIDLNLSEPGHYATRAQAAKMVYMILHSSS
jgi:hypothetical protein